jgi:hypothetical protein
MKRDPPVFMSEHASFTPVGEGRNVVGVRDLRAQWRENLIVDTASAN